MNRYFNKQEKRLDYRKCPFTGENLYYTGRRHWVLDGPSYFENESGTIKYSVCPRSQFFSHNNIHYRFDDNQWVEYIKYCYRMIPITTSEKEKNKIFKDYKRSKRRRFINGILYALRLKKKIFPLSKRVKQHTIGLDLVSVKPMEQPTGKLMWLDYVYGETHSKDLKNE